MINKDIKYGCAQRKEAYTELADVQNYTILTRALVKPKAGAFKWHIVNLTADMDKYKTILAIEKVFDLFKPIFDPIRFESTKEFGDAHIKIYFVSNNLSESVVRPPALFDTGVLAYAFPLKWGNIYRGHVYMNDDYKWADMHKEIKQNGVTYIVNAHLRSVLAHELGHVLSLGHSEVEDALMFASYTGEKFRLHADDRAGIRDVWGDYIDEWKAKLMPEEVETVEETPKVDTTTPTVEATKRNISGFFKFIWKKLFG